MAASEMNIRLSLPCSDDLYETEELKNQKVLRVWPEVESVQTTAFVGLSLSSHVHIAYVFRPGLSEWVLYSIEFRLLFIDL